MFKFMYVKLHKVPRKNRIFTQIVFFIDSFIFRKTFCFDTTYNISILEFKIKTSKARGKLVQQPKVFAASLK